MNNIPENNKICNTTESGSSEPHRGFSGRLQLLAELLSGGFASAWEWSRSLPFRLKKHRADTERKQEADALKTFLKARESHPEFRLYACNHKRFIAGADNLASLLQELREGGYEPSSRNLLIAEDSKKTGAATLYKNDGTVWLLFPDLGEPVSAMGGKWSWDSAAS